MAFVTPDHESQLKAQSRKLKDKSKQSCLFCLELFSRQTKRYLYIQGACVSNAKIFLLRLPPNSYCHFRLKNQARNLKNQDSPWSVLLGYKSMVSAHRAPHLLCWRALEVQGVRLRTRCLTSAAPCERLQNGNICSKAHWNL